MADVLLYTANFGGYDDVREQAAQDIDVDWLCLTDDPLEWVPEPWRTLPVQRRYPGANLSAKFHKAHPPFALGDWKYAIWVDANMQITTPAFAREAIASISDGMAIWAHPRRDCVYDELEASLGKESQGGRYDGLPLREQVASYEAEGFPHHHGLFASGTIVWTRASATNVGEAWWAELERWGCFHDQLALPVVCWRLGVKPGIFPVHQIERRYTPRGSRFQRFWLGNRWLRIYNHRGA